MVSCHQWLDWKEGKKDRMEIQKDGQKTITNTVLVYTYSHPFTEADLGGGGGGAGRDPTPPPKFCEL